MYSSLSGFYSSSPDTDLILLIARSVKGKEEGREEGIKEGRKKRREERGEGGRKERRKEGSFPKISVPSDF